MLYSVREHPQESPIPASNNSYRGLIRAARDRCRCSDTPPGYRGCNARSPRPGPGLCDAGRHTPTGRDRREHGKYDLLNEQVDDTPRDERKSKNGKEAFELFGSAALAVVVVFALLRGFGYWLFGLVFLRRNFRLWRRRYHMAAREHAFCYARERKRRPFC